MSGNKFYSTSTFFEYADAVELVHSGNDYFEKLTQLIASAKIELHIQTYIFNTDTTGIAIIEELIKAAQRGVKIFLLLDAYGSKSFEKETIEKLKKENINIRFFSPVFSFKNVHIGRRLHHKIVVADETKAIIGGINIADKYKGGSSEKAWLDYAVKIEGTACMKIQAICNDFYFHNKSSITYNHTNNNISNGTPIRIKQNDWLHYKNEIAGSYLSAIKAANTEAIIVGSYFLPGLRFRRALKKANKRGVKIKIILAGVSDVPIVKNATTYFYSFLLRNNIELYEWQESVLHGKAIVIDNKWSTVGSFNINRLSKYSSVEMNIEIHSKKFAENFTKHLNEVIEKSNAILPKQYEAKNFWFNKLINWLSFHLVRIASNIVTTFTYKRYFKNYFKS